MKIQILPNIFKKIGLLLFFLSFINPWMIGFFEGLLGMPCDCENWTTPYWMKVLETVSLSGMILYFLAKENIEDELVYRLRLEAMSITFIIGLGVLWLIQLLSINSLFNIKTSVVFYCYMILFLIIYHYKKRNFSL